MQIIFTLFLMVLSAASFYRDWYRPEYLRDKDGNPPQFPMPYVTMMTCIGTGVMNFLVAVAAQFNIKIAVAWAILIFIVCILAIATELVANIRKWQLMNWPSIALILLNWITFVILAIIY